MYSWMALSRRRFLSFVAAVGVRGANALSPVVVELFTSEGCSSCPPADAALSKLARGELVPDVPILALGEHVDYWDQLGWKDAFSKRLFSDRQAAYAEFFHRDGAYTPQMIVDGVTEFVGSDSAAARTAILAAARKPKARVQLQWGRRIDVRIYRLESSAEIADVYLAITEDALTTRVGRGENGGRTLRHDAVVRSWKHLGVWRGAGEFSATDSGQIDSTWNRDNVSAMVIAQSRKSNRIIAAGAIRAAAGA